MPEAETGQLAVQQPADRDAAKPIKEEMQVPRGWLPAAPRNGVLSFMPPGPNWLG